MKINNILMILAVIGLLFAAGCASGKAGDDTITMTGTNNTNTTNGTIIITQPTTLNDTNQTNKSVIPPRPPKYENDTNTTVNGTNYTS